jgi:hypothetical protein
MTRFSVLGYFLVAVVTAAACGRTTDDPASSGAADAALDASTLVPEDAASPVDVDVADAALGRCTGATYTTAPSGAACDVMRIQPTQGLSPNCYGPRVGAGCVEFQVSVANADVAKLPAGFHCGSPELNVTTCAWSFDDDASATQLHTIDDAALEGACAATIALPATDDVTCVVAGD